MTSKIHEYRGKSILVTYDAERCIHAAECVRGLPGVFNPRAKPWVAPDAAGAGEVAEVVMRCPTGALQLERLDGEAAPSAPEENTIAVCADGPLYARGEVEVVDGDGALLVRDTRVALCRCGASANKPYCDGSHSKAEFRDDGAIPDPRIKPGDAERGKLTVTVTAGGPLILDGPVSISGGEDRCAGGRGALCRCGASENKPFCDGTHNKIGFSG